MYRHALTLNCSSSIIIVPVDMGSIDKVLEEFDNVMCPNVATAVQHPRSLIDASSLLWRLEVRMLNSSELQVQVVLCLW